jgi:hypothetical protein
MIIIAIACLVLGVWGIWDYAVAIPAQHTAYERFRVLESVRDALETEPGSEAFAERVSEARRGTRAEIDAIVDRVVAAEGLAVPGPDDPASVGWPALMLIYSGDEVEMPPGFEPTGDQEQARAVIEAARGDREFPWLRQMLLFWTSLHQKRQPGQPLTGLALGSLEGVRQLIDQAGSPKKPNKFDRLTQWAFILCLPCTPYFLWLWARARRRSYRLDDDGTLHLPETEGAWAREDIADIDMDRWMAKSVAWAVHRDGRRAKLDDYLYKDLHLIVGALAHRFHPDQWEENAKQVKAGPGDEPPADGDPGLKSEVGQGE